MITGKLISKQAESSECLIKACYVALNEKTNALLSRWLEFLQSARQK